MSDTTVLSFIMNNITRIASYRAAGGGFGGYLSCGVVVALLADKRLELKGASPFIEYQRRVPFAAPGRGDNRFTFGLMMALCAHCGFD